jgi:hypothetical protein
MAVSISSAGQPGECGWAVDDSNWRFDESFGIAGHDGVATARFRRGCAHGVLEVGPAKGQGSTQNLPVNRRHCKGAQDSVGRASSESGALGAGNQVEDGRDPMSWDVPPALAPLEGSPQARRAGRFGSIQDNVEHDV